MSQIETIIARAMSASKAWPVVFEAGTAAELARAAVIALDAAGFVVMTNPTEAEIEAVTRAWNKAFNAWIAESRHGTKETADREAAKAFFIAARQVAPQKTYADGIEDAAQIIDRRADEIEKASTSPVQSGWLVRQYRLEAAAIRALGKEVS